MELRKPAFAFMLLVALAVTSVACASGPGTGSTRWTPTMSGGMMQFSSPPPMTIDKNKQYTATIKTNFGDIVIELLAKEAPATVNNFVSLARQGYFNGVKFHRVIKDFVIQSGDPTGTGRGGPGYQFDDELPVKRSYDDGIVAMANAGPNTNGSQFFIGIGSKVRNLNNVPNYTIFGRVTAGLDVAKKIGEVPVTGPEPSSPTVDVHIDTVTIEEK